MKNLLWTDIAFFMVLFLGFMVMGLLCRSLPVRVALVEVFKRPLAACSGIVLFIFIGVGVLDSLPVQWSTQRAGVQAEMHGTMLDYILLPVGQVYEKSYSRPLSLFALHRASIATSAGFVERAVHLQHVNATLTTAQAKITYIQSQLLRAAAGSTLLCAILLLIACFMAYYRNGRHNMVFGKSGVIIIVFLWCVLFFVMSLYLLSRGLHVFGTGKVGEDVFYYTVKSIRTALIIGMVTSVIMLPLAVAFGIAAGYFGGFIDDMIQYIYTTLSAIPGVLLIAAAILSMQIYIANHPQIFSSLEKAADARLLALCCILGVTSWTSLCRILRAEALKLREADFVQAARALGSSSFYICTRHLLSNMVPIILITLVLDFSFLVLAEAVLSYVGVGVSPTTMSFGNLINSARLELAREPMVWWPIVSAFIFMFTLVLSSNLVADALREAFDPYRSHRQVRAT